MIYMAIRNAVFSFTSRARGSWSADSPCLAFSMNMIEKTTAEVAGACGQRSCPPWHWTKSYSCSSDGDIDYVQ